MSEILLSICIPTYNREKTVLNNVKKYLKMLPDKVDLVICDNGSIDNTYVALSEINDKKVNVYKNKVNKGFTYNLMKVIKKAKGKFVCLMSDEDFLCEESLLEVLNFLSNKYIQENIMGVICDSFDEKEEMTKIEEFINIIYGRVSYMSGLILNRSKMSDKDLEYTETIYPHIGILLKMAVKGKIVFSSMQLIEKGKEAFSETQGIVQKDSAFLSYVHPLKRLEQLVIDSEMVLCLDIEDNIKDILMRKLFSVKLLQGTIIYELIRRNKNMRKNYNLKQEDTKDYLYNFFVEYRCIIKDKLGIEDNNKINLYFKELVDYIENVRKNRNEYDSLVKKQEYIHIILGSKKNLMQHIENMKKFEFKIDRVCTKENIGKDNYPIEVIQYYDLSNYPKIVIVVSKQDQDYIEELYTMQLQEAHLFIIEDLALTT